MKLTQNYPIYLNPTFPEICELAKTGWDTIRICVDDDTGDLLLASGYGNTHNTIYTHYKQVNKRPWLTPFILYKESGIAYFNTEDIHGGNMRDRRWMRFLADDHVEVLKDLIRESNLCI